MYLPGSSPRAFPSGTTNAPVCGHVIPTTGCDSAVAIHDEQRSCGVAAPIHRDAVLLDVVEAEAPRSAEQVEADRRLPGEDFPIATLRDRPRSTELEATMALLRNDVHDAADGIGTEGS